MILPISSKLTLSLLIGLLFLCACGPEIAENSPQPQIERAESAAGISNTGLDFATKLKMARELPSAQLCQAVLPLQSVAEVFALSKDHTRIEYYSGFMPQFKETDVIKIISNELRSRISSADKSCVSQHSTNYRGAFNSCMEEAKKRDEFWFTKSGLKKRCDQEARDLVDCDPFPSDFFFGNEARFGDCGCTAKSLEAACGSQISSRATLNYLINANVVRKKREADTRAAKERQLQKDLQNSRRNMNAILRCTAREGLPGSISINCF